MTTTTTTTNAALEAARDAHEHHFDSHRGAFCDDDADTVTLYDNCPWKGRALEHAMLRRWLSVNGYAWTEGQYPLSGEDRGYTMAFVIELDDREAEPIFDAWREAIAITHAMAAEGTLDRTAAIATHGGSA